MFNLTQTVTVWRKISSDGFGGYSYTRISILGQYAKTANQVTDELGKVTITSPELYTRAALLIGDMVSFQDVADLTPTADAKPVVDLAETVIRTNLKRYLI